MTIINLDRPVIKYWDIDDKHIGITCYSDASRKEVKDVLLKAVKFESGRLKPFAVGSNPPSWSYRIHKKHFEVLNNSFQLVKA